MAHEQCTFARLWCKFVAMFAIHQDSRVRCMAAPLLIICLQMMPTFSSWAMSICTEIRHEYGIHLNPANAVEAVMLLVHTVAAGKADQHDSDLYTIRNTEFQCTFEDERLETSYDKECMTTSAILVFLCGCMAALHSYNVHKKFLLGTFQCTDPGNAQARCPKRRHEMACFYWLVHEFKKLPVSAHMEIVHIINRFWRDQVPTSRHSTTFSALRDFLLRNETFLAHRATAADQKISEDTCRFIPRRQHVGESKQEEEGAWHSTASSPSSSMAFGSASSQAAASSSSSMQHQHDSSPPHCPLGALARRMHMCKREFIDYIIGRAHQLCQSMSGAQHLAIEDDRTLRPQGRCCVSRVPQLQGDPNDVLYLDQSGQFAVRSQTRCEDIGCPIS